MINDNASRNSLYYFMAFVLIAFSMFTFHLENEINAYQDLVVKDEAIIRDEEILLGEYQKAMDELKVEMKAKDKEIAFLNRQKTELVKEVKFFDYTLHTVDLMRVNTFLEPENEDIVKLASAMTEEELYSFVKHDIGYNRKTESDLAASDILQSGEGNCVEKAVLLASLLRAKGYSPDSVHVVLGTINFKGLPGEPPENHAWVELEKDGVWRVLDTTTYLGDFTFSEWTKDDFYPINRADDFFIYNDKISLIVNKVD
jgi:cell division protein FtsB